ncbi:MAG: hypothetical protein WCJ19_00740 [bacterium]
MKDDVTKYLELLTDDFGVWQHADKYNILKEEGYALDDSARALIVFLYYKKFEKASVCLKYIENSIINNRLVLYFNKERKPILESTSLDAQGLALWALTFSMSSNFEVVKCLSLYNLINKDVLDNTEYVRPIAYYLLSSIYLNSKDKADISLNKLIEKFDFKNGWFENKLIYANAVIPFSLISYCHHFNIQDENLFTIILQSISILEKNMRIGIIPAPVGNRIWQDIGSVTKDIYGQQPIDVAFMVLLLVKAYKFFNDTIFLTKAEEWMSWFYGNNILHELIISCDGSCYDGIEEFGVNTHKGAESTIMYLWAKYYFDNAY